MLLPKDTNISISNGFYDGFNRTFEHLNKFPPHTTPVPHATSSPQVLQPGTTSSVHTAPLASVGQAFPYSWPTQGQNPPPTLLGRNPPYANQGASIQSLPRAQTTPSASVGQTLPYPTQGVSVETLSPIPSTSYGQALPYPTDGVCAQALSQSQTMAAVSIN